MSTPRCLRNPSNCGRQSKQQHENASCTETSLCHLDLTDVDGEEEVLPRQLGIRFSMRNLLRRVIPLL